MPYIIGEIPPPPSGAPPFLVPDPPQVDFPDLDGLPEYELEATFTQQYLQTAGTELQLLEQARQELILSWFPATSGTLLEFYEQMLGLPVNPPVALGTRQATVLAYMQSLKANGTGLAWEATLTALMGPTWSYQEHIPGDGSTPPAYTIKILYPVAAPATPPSGLTATPSTSAGSLPLGDYYYAVTALTTYGETEPCAPVEATLASGGEIVLSWASEGSPITSYNVYRGADIADLFLLTNVTGSSFTDDGTLSLTGTPAPGLNTSGSPNQTVIENLARAITPAHIVLEYGTIGGFILGVSALGDTL